VEEYQTVLLAAGAAILLIVVSGIAVAMVRRRRRARAAASPLPLIPFSAGHDRVAGPARPDRAVRAPASTSFDRAAAPTPVWSPPVDGVAGARQASPYAPPPPITSPAPSAGAAGPAVTPLANMAQPNDAIAGTAFEGASMRYWRPADGTLQFLPGRLEVIAGHDAGHDIRFVRTPGPDGTRVTFGRAEGAPYRHIQLREPTVSRTHARMTLDVSSRNGADASTSTPRWRLENLSATNPVVVNGTPLTADESDQCSVILDDGDRIEMGEVVFRFRAR
jgi:hypothetical protein